MRCNLFWRQGCWDCIGKVSHSRIYVFVTYAAMSSAYHHQNGGKKVQFCEDSAQKFGMFSLKYELHKTTCFVILFWNFFNQAAKQFMHLLLHCCNYSIRQNFHALPSTWSGWRLVDAAAVLCMYYYLKNPLILLHQTIFLRVVAKIINLWGWASISVKQDSLLASRVNWATTFETSWNIYAFGCWLQSKWVASSSAASHPHHLRISPAVQPFSRRKRWNVWSKNHVFSRGLLNKTGAVIRPEDCSVISISFPISDNLHDQYEDDVSAAAADHC